MRISDLSTDVCSAERRPAGPAGIRGEIKEGASAASGCRGTFATKACRSRRARQVATRRAIGQEAGNPSRSSVKNQKKRFISQVRGTQIGRAHVRTPVTNAHIVCRLLLAKKTKTDIT